MLIALNTRYIFSGADAALLKITAAASGGFDRLYSHLDNQGSVIALTDQSRNLRGQVSYDPYGNSATISGTAFGFGYTGQRYDSESGLYYYKARYYSPKLGRFLSNDPIGYRDNINMYAYVGNDPLNNVDPTGMCIDAGSELVNDAWIASTAWHFEERAALNAPYQSLTYNEVSSSDSWTHLTGLQDDAHQNGVGLDEFKYINSNGGELVFDGNTQKLVTDTKIMATYNYFTPIATQDVHGFNDAIDFASMGIMHGIIDYLPWVVLGNVRGPN